MANSTYRADAEATDDGTAGASGGIGRWFAFLGHLSVKMRIALLGAVPLIALLAGSVTMLVEKNALLAEMGDIREMAVVAQDSGGLVHELQKERGASAGFLGSKGRKFGAELEAQRKQSDGALQVLTATLKKVALGDISAALAKKMDRAQTLLAGLADMRRRVSAQDVEVKEALGFYTAAIGSLLDVIAGMSAVSSNAEVNNRIVAYYTFSQMKERNGIERAVGSNGFAAGAFEGLLYRRLVSLIAQQEAFLATFTRWASADQRAFYESTVAGPAVDEVERMRAVALESQKTGTTGGVDAGYWFTTITKKINLLKKVEDRLAADVVATADTVAAGLRDSFFVIATTVIALLVVMGAAVFFTVRGITGPLASMGATMSKLAQGDRNVEVPATDRRDEIGDMARTVQVFKDNAIEMDRMAEEQKEQERRAEEEKRRMMHKLADDLDASINGVVQTVASTATQMRSSAEAMAATAEETDRQATAVAAAAEEAATNIQTVASAAEELSSSIDEISRQVAESTRISQEAVAEAGTTNDMVQGLAEAASKIGEVVELINDIASQTNLLALNATIEAARAGDAGKGFAVVASEVKSLANQTAKATEDISAQITAIQEATGGAVGAIEGIGKTIGQINEIATAIAAAVEEQGAATAEIARNVSQTATGTQEVTANISGVTQAAGETGQAANQVLEASGELSSQSEALGSEVHKFLEQIRAA